MLFPSICHCITRTLPKSWVNGKIQQEPSGKVNLKGPFSLRTSRLAALQSGSRLKMATPSELSLEEIRKYLLENGGSVRNHDLVKYFMKFLTDPETRGNYFFTPDNAKSRKSDVHQKV